MHGRAFKLSAMLRKHHGLTLIELLMFITVVGIALSAMLSVFVQATQASSDPMIRRQQLAIAESLLREVQLMPFTYCDPDDANATTAASSGGCASLAEGSGPEGGETRYGPSSRFDNVNDYAGFVSNRQPGRLGSVRLQRQRGRGGHGTRHRGRR